MTKQINTIKDVNVGDVFYYYEADTRYRKPRSVAVVAVGKKYITVDVGGGKYEQLEKFQINRTVSGFAVKQETIVMLTWLKAKMVMTLLQNGIVLETLLVVILLRLTLIIQVKKQFTIF